VLELRARPVERGQEITDAHEAPSNWFAGRSKRRLSLAPHPLGPLRPRLRCRGAETIGGWRRLALPGADGQGRRDLRTPHGGDADALEVSRHGEEGRLVPGVADELEPERKAGHVASHRG